MVAEALSDKGAKVPKTVAVNFSQTLAGSASATATLITPSPGKRVVVVSLHHIQLGAIGSKTKVQFLSDSTPITGTILSNVVSYTQPSHLSSGYMPDGHFWAAVDEPLVMKVTNGSSETKLCTVQGTLGYFEE